MSTTSYGTKTKKYKYNKNKPRPFDLALFLCLVYMTIYQWWFPVEIIWKQQNLNLYLLIFICTYWFRDFTSSLYIFIFYFFTSNITYFLNKRDIKSVVKIMWCAIPLFSFSVHINFPLAVRYFINPVSLSGLRGPSV